MSLLGRRRHIVPRSHSHDRRRSGRLLAVASLFVGSTGGCIGTLQRELEVLFAADAFENALLIPQSIVYDIFGSTLFKILEWR
jgi:hypothetical protein